MTAKYSELAVAEPIFGELRNCMDLAIVGALVAKENLAQRAGHDFALLFDTASVKTDEFAAPKQVDSRVSMMKKGTNWIISASGGVAIHAWSTVQDAQKSAAPAAARAKLAPADTAKWCSN
jgi:hypothetical protein